MSMEIHVPKKPPIAAPAPAPMVILSTPDTSQANAPPNTVPTKIPIKNRRPPISPIPRPKTIPIPVATYRKVPPSNKPMRIPTVPIMMRPNTTSIIFFVEMSPPFPHHRGKNYSSLISIEPKSTSTPGPLCKEIPHALGAGSWLWISTKSL